MDEKYYWWQSLSTSTVHCGYRVVVEYEVEVTYYRRGGCAQRYTGRSRQFYVPA